MKGETNMRDLLATYYGIQANERTVWNGVEGFKHNNLFYFTISADQREIIHMEQAALAYYLYENNYTQTALPVPNRKGEWYTEYHNKNHMVFQLEDNPVDRSVEHGASLAHFHQTGSRYQYEPQAISSYGQWKQLWIDKLTAFEKQIEVNSAEYPNEYHRLLIDVLPYIVGLSENAIQYMQESEYESRFHEVDQGTISFRRYHGELVESTIWTTDLVYDHPIRDLAEYFRFKLLKREDPMSEIKEFLNEYKQVRTLSIFSWRLLYARLLFPIHLFDIMEQGFIGQQYEERYDELEKIFEHQTIYEGRLGNLFDYLGIDSKELQIPMLHWL